jgi:hypothetical protein
MPRQVDGHDLSTPFADAHAALVGDVAVPDGLISVEADAVGKTVAPVGPDASIRQAAVGGDVERG